jgi:hypothetical protein
MHTVEVYNIYTAVYWLAAREKYTSHHAIYIYSTTTYVYNIYDELNDTTADHMTDADDIYIRSIDNHIGGDRYIH